MSDVERLEAELEMARVAEKLEVARDAMHADRNPKTIKAYRKACDVMVRHRQEFRGRWRVVVGPGDAAPEIETVKLEAGARPPGVDT